MRILQQLVAAQDVTGVFQQDQQQLILPVVRRRSGVAVDGAQIPTLAVGTKSSKAMASALVSGAGRRPPGAPAADRRPTLRMRASSSRSSNGLVT